MKRLFTFSLCAILVFTLFACGMQQPAPSTEPTVAQPPVPKTLKILAIGNSFSVDAMTHLYSVAKAEGVEEVVLGNLFVGGCTLKMHADYIESGEAPYIYYKNTTGAWEQTDGCSLLQGLQDEQWDIITMQQGSSGSGLVDTYQPYLDNLIAYVNENKTNPDSKLVWHMTWAYQSNSTHSAFPNYGSSQQAMYYGIVNCLQKVIDTKSEFALTIPVGTAIQNARTSYLGDTLTRDGYHLNEYARLLASYTWFAALTGRTLDSLNIGPIVSVNLSDSDKAIIVESVNNAVATPQSVTYSNIKTR